MVCKNENFKNLNSQAGQGRVSKASLKKSYNNKEPTNPVTF
jgi:hypothetical protein